MTRDLGDSNDVPLPQFLRFLLSSVFQGFRFQLQISVISVNQWYVLLQMEKKIFWLLFTVLGVVMGIFLPLWWNLALTLPLLVLCWWIVYRSGWLS